VYALRARKRYDRFLIARRRGGRPREIYAPIKPIKDLQRRLAEVLTRCYEPPPNAHGFVPGRSPLSNAKWHQSKEWVLKADLADFFPSIHFGRVRGMFMAYPFEYSSEVATLLAQICCHHRQLPQGAPTSPIITNFICRRLDTQLARVARDERCHYTRYADDICVSTDRRSFPPSLASLSASGSSQAGPLLTEIVRGNGFSLNPEKTRLTRRSQRQRVTGLVVNEKVNVSTEYVRSLRNVLYIWARYGHDDAARAFARCERPNNRAPGKGDPQFARTIRGRVQYVGTVKGWSSPVYRRLAKALEAVDSSFRPQTLRTLESHQVVRLYTEGPSDPNHLVAAHSYFIEQAEFTNLEFEIPEDVAAGGGSELAKKCLAFAEYVHPDVPCVFVFDRDDEAPLKKVVGGTDSRDHGNNVAAVALAVPPWRDQKVCIEMLYEDDDLRRRDPAGRRLYLGAEFDRRTGHHRTEPVHVVNPGDPSLVREDVYTLDDAESVGLSKLAFSECIASRSGEFAAPINFEGFRRTFEIIEGIVARMRRD
jgi:RNA-directed DNA polymerase